MAQSQKQNNPGERIAHFRCKGCGETNESPYPEVRVITQKGVCNCGKTEAFRIWRWVAPSVVLIIVGIATAINVSEYLEWEYTTRQVEALPDDYKVVPIKGRPNMGPEYEVVEKSPEEKMIDHLKEELKREREMKKEKPDDKAKTGLGPK